MPRETVTAKFEIVTPMFVAGADNSRDGVPELRVPSILGALRFWWRSLAWARLPAGSPAAALRKLKEWEADLFGSAETGQGKFVARVMLPTAPQVRQPTPNFNAVGSSVGGYTGWLNDAPAGLTAHQLRKRWQDRSAGVAYLAGQSLTSYPPDGAAHGALKRTRDVRPSIASGRFNLALISRGPVLDHAPPGAPTIRDAIIAFGLLGGLGARTRRGLGSIRLTAIEGAEFECPNSIDDYWMAVRALLEPLMGGQRWSVAPPYSAFWQGTSTVIALAGDDGERVASPREILLDLGRRFQRFRGWGQNGEVGGQPAEWTGPPYSIHGARAQRWRFEDDHDWYKAIGASPGTKPVGTLANHAPRRAIMGLPQLYKKVGNNITPTVKPRSTPTTDVERRASPLLFHIHKLDDPSRSFAVVTLFQSAFLPNPGTTPGSVKLEIETGTHWDVDLTPNWAVVGDFLNCHLGTVFPILP